MLGLNHLLCKVLKLCGVQAVAAKQKAEDISAVLYPNDSTEYGKELRLKQQVFFVSASIQDVLRRYKVQFPLSTQ